MVLLGSTVAVGQPTEQDKSHHRDDCPCVHCRPGLPINDWIPLAVVIAGIGGVFIILKKRD